MNGHGHITTPAELEAHEAIVRGDSRPWFLLRAITEPSDAIRVPRMTSISNWLTKRIIHLDIFASGVKNYHLLPEGMGVNYYYYFMGEPGGPISFVKILPDASVLYGAPAFTPIGMDIYPEMLVPYLIDFTMFCRDLYGILQYKQGLKIQIALIHVGGRLRKVSNISEWRPIPPALVEIRDDVLIEENLDFANEADTGPALRRCLNRFLMQVGFPRQEDSPLPPAVERKLSRLV